MRSSTKDNIDGLTAVVLILLLVSGVIGWCLNIGKLIAADAITGLEVLRGVGIIVPIIGAVTGWM